MIHQLPSSAIELRVTQAGDFWNVLQEFAALSLQSCLQMVSLATQDISLNSGILHLLSLSTFVIKKTLVKTPALIFLLRFAAL